MSVQYTGGCAVQRGYSVHRGYHWVYRGCSVHWGNHWVHQGVFSTLGDIMSTPRGDQCSGGYHEYTGGYHVECGGYHVYTGGMVRLGIDWYINKMKYTVKPLYSGHHWDLEKVSAMRRCPLYRGLTFFSNEMTFRSLSGQSLSRNEECERKWMETSSVCYIPQPRKSI